MSHKVVDLVDLGFSLIEAWKCKYIYVQKHGWLGWLCVSLSEKAQKLNIFMSQKVVDLVDLGFPLIKPPKSKYVHVLKRGWLGWLCYS